MNLVGLVLTSLVVVVSQIAVTVAFNPAAAADLVPTTTVLKLDADSTGTVEVTASGVTPQGFVDLWVDSTWQRDYTLVDGKVDIDLGTQALGDHQITARYRGDNVTSASITTVKWTAPGTVQAPTTTSVKVDAGATTGTITVAADVALTAQVDLWIDSTWLRAYTLVDGKASFDLGAQSAGDHQVTARYRGNTTSKPSQVTIKWTAPGTVQVATTTKVQIATDSNTGTITVAADGVTPTAQVDLWVNSTWLRAYTLVDGKASFDLGVQPGGDNQVTARYRGNSTSKPSQITVPWSLTTADQVATTSTVTVLPDGTGSVKVSAEDGSATTNQVDLWVNGQYTKAYDLVDGKATFALGTRAGGDQVVGMRYRPGPTQRASIDTEIWSVDTNPVPAPTACGPEITKSDGQAWNCTFADDFEGTSLDGSKWVAQNNFAKCYTERACYSSSAANVSVADGNLRLTLRSQELTAPTGGATFTAYVSSMVTTFHRFSQKYGRFEARIKNTDASTPGLHEAFWLWPDDRYPEGAGIWPSNGELDISETYSQHPDVSVPFLHTNADLLGPRTTGPAANTAYNCEAHRGVYNTYAMEWTPERIEIFVNGKSCLVNTSDNEAFKKRYIMALTQVLGTQGNALVEGTPMPATMWIDYVRVWS